MQQCCPGTTFKKRHFPIRLLFHIAILTNAKLLLQKYKQHALPIFWVPDRQPYPPKIPEETKFQSQQK